MERGVDGRVIRGGGRDARSDEALVAHCLEGEAAAWEELVGRHAGLVWTIARRSGLAPEEAEDVFQTAFVLAWRNLGLLDRPAAVAGWIATIARREAWRARRKRAARAERETPAEDAVDAPADRPLPDEELARLERRALLERAVGRLDRKCRELLEALFLEEPPPAYAEVAERLGMPIGSLGPTRGRCLGKLRRILERMGWEVSSTGPPSSTPVKGR